MSNFPAKPSVKVPQQPGILHTIQDTFPVLTAFEHTPGCPNLIIFIDGMWGALGNVPYVRYLPGELTNVEFGVAQFLPTSTGMGWTTGSIRTDAEELVKCVEYFRKLGKKRIVLMGHSTGCQDIVAYHFLPNHPPVDAVILQAGVSDREFIESRNPKVHEELAKLPVDQPVVSEGVIMSYKRWISVAAKPTSDEIDIDVSEDFFSSDLSDERLANVFKPVDTPILFLLSGEDEHYPPHVKEDVPALLERYQEAVEKSGRPSYPSRVVRGASHNVGQELPRKEMTGWLRSFLGQIMALPLVA